MPKPRKPLPPEPAEADLQQSSARSIAKQEQLKRIVKQHPQRDIPRVESVEPADAPPKE
ncbi:MAG: hypothetical protein AB1830_05915 [Pseudomonadota bacterium]